MTRSLRSRLPLLAVAAAVLALPAIAIAASSLKVRGPAHPERGKRISVGATGHAGQKLVLQVTIHRHGKCKATYGDDRDSGSYVVFATFVERGDFDKRRTGLRFPDKTNGHYCAYLGRPNDLVYDPPVARSTKHFQVVDG